TAVFIRPGLLLDPAETFVRGKAIQDVIASHQERIADTESARRAQFEHAVGRHAVRGEWRAIDTAPAAELAAQARYADLAVVAREDPSDPLATPPGLVHSVVLTAGRPVVVLPPRCLVTRV